MKQKRRLHEIQEIVEPIPKSKKSAKMATAQQI